MKISLVVPVLNEEKAIPIFYNAVRVGGGKSLDSIDVEIVFINDGSTDSTEKITDFQPQTDQSIQVISFIRNFDEWLALFASLEYVSSDAVNLIDVGLRSPNEVTSDPTKNRQTEVDVTLVETANRLPDTLPLKPCTCLHGFRD